MNPQKRKVEQFLKLARRQVAYLPLGVLSVVLGAFVVGAIVNAASLTPPTAAYPEGQPQLDLGGGGGASNLLEVLRGSKPPAALVVGASYATWGDWKGDTVIGGRLGLGQVRTTVAGTQRIGYPLDIQIVHKVSEDPTDAELVVNEYLNKNNTAVLRIASGSTKTNEKLYTGMRLDRLGVVSDPLREDTFNEKWFIGMDNANDNLIIRANGSTNVVSIDPDKGAACFGAMYVGKTQTPYDGLVNDTTGGGGYIKANATCADIKDKKGNVLSGTGAHVCTTDEIMRTVVCNSSALADSGGAWIIKGPPGYTQLLSNDCGGWTTNSPDGRGGKWNFNAKGGYGTLNACGNSTARRLPFACCK